jgi:hypothetical protein
MLMQAIWPRRAAAAAIAATFFTVPMIAVAQMDQSGDAAQAAKAHPKKHRQSHPGKEPAGQPLDLSAFATNTAAPAPSRPPQASASEARDTLCPNGYINYEPPCQATFPQADPNYHGPGGR